MIAQVSIIIAVLCYAFSAALFAVEAWPKSVRQALFIIFLPGYVLYYALINSARELPFRLLLMVSVFLGVVIPVVYQIVLRARG